MIRVCLIIFALFAAIPIGMSKEADPCAHDATEMMQLSIEAFDKTPDSGWRTVGDIEGCEGTAADLIEAYRARIEDHRRGLIHHEAQLRAAAGETEKALNLFDQLIEFKTDAANLAYYKATRAFVARDRLALEAARAELAAVPPPDGFLEGVERFKLKYPDMPEPIWPLNLDVVEGFLNCFDRPYREAYSDECRDKD
ncbi:MAG: hypothetical protein AAGI14_11370 [Pseudomonadota bacterium]